MKSRLKEKWSEPKELQAFFTGSNPEFKKLYEKVFGKPKNTTGKLDFSFMEGIYNSCEEIIYSYEKERGHLFHFIVRSVCVEKLKIVIEPILQAYGFDTDEDLKKEVAIAMGFNVPIYGDNEEFQKKIDILQKEIIEEGFQIEGKKYKLTKYNNFNTDNLEKALKSIVENEKIFPFEVKLLGEIITPNIELAIRLNKLEEVIDDFEQIINSSERNENKIQKFLTENPILLGTQYRNVIPKHLLGSEYEMDYALERFDGVFDLMEIESSNLKLFTQSGNPTQHLVHAEQQVLDWQQWLEEKNFYAQEKLKGITSPKGLVIIGRNDTEETMRKIKRRNASFNAIKILTYDDLIEKSKTLLNNIRLNKESN